MLEHPQLTNSSNRKVALITGTSRGIGAEITRSLATANIDIIGNYKDPNKQKRAFLIEQAVTSLGVRMHSILADISKPDDITSLVSQSLNFAPQGIDYLILNAAGGLEEGKGDDWAEKINIHAQLALVDNFLPYIRGGGKIIYLTSLWAHKFGQVKQLPTYTPVARTKYRCEQLLFERIPQFNQKDIRLGIVCGHLIKGTAAYSIFLRGFKEEIQKLQQSTENNQFADTKDMAEGVKDMVINNHSQGHIIYIGGETAEPIEPIQSKILNRDEIKTHLPMYGDSKLYIDQFVYPENIARYTIKESDCEGHFGNGYSQIKLFRGVDQIEASAQALGLTAIISNPTMKPIPIFRGVEKVAFNKMIFPTDTITLQPINIKETGTAIRGDCLVKIEDKVVSSFEGFDLPLIPNIEIALKLIKRQRLSRQ